MHENVLYRKIRDGDEKQVFALAKAGFEEFVLADVTKEGAREDLRQAVRD
jgi:hypothetical protein